MNALTSEADIFIFISSPSGKSDHYIMQSEEEEEPMSDDAEETPIVRTIIVMKGKGKEVKTAMKGRAKATLEPHDQTAVKWKQTKGFLLHEQITTTWDHFDMDKNTYVTSASL